jgi:outer membrane protein assembly factor BamB
MKTVFRLAAACAVALSACASGASGQLPSEWRMFRLNPELNAVVAPDNDLAARWTFKTNGGISSSPTLSGDTVFVASNDGSLYALDLRSGQLRWKYAASNDLMTAPLVINNTIIVAEGNNYGTNFTPPRYLLLATGSNSIIGVNKTTGKQVWRFFVPGSAMPTGSIVNGVYLHHDASGMLFALRAGDGKYLWREYLRSTATMAASNNFRGTDVVTSGDYPNDVIAYDGTSGAVRWRVHFSDEGASFDDCPPASDGRNIYAMYLAHPGDSRFNFVGYTTPGIQHAYALDGTTGKILWDVPLARGIVPINNSATIPLVYNGSLYLGSAIVPRIFALDTNTGKLRWQLRIAGTMKGGMAAVNGVVYFGDDSGTLWAVDAQRGRVLGRKHMPDGFNVGSPIIVGKTLIIGSKKGYIYAVPLSEI